ncbi:hypothetical protein [Rahnella sp. ChDrAdgB13]|uniref:hypothetical protein n=1 Tax=Rahnella sp. ChDrAdgB13 TaxID=1850581 RepID=UPI001AD87D54|nr:hypothetical protein [Rahnella sp. ChDrAdgB13]
MTKELNGSFPQAEKEPVIERVFKLVERYPSRSAAARAWGINVNTLKNYYRRKEIQPVPRHSQLAKIAEVEGVTMEWLTSGEGDGPTDTNKNQKNQSELPRGNNLEKLSEMLSFLDEEERRGLVETLTRKGVETVLYLLDEDNIKLLRLDRVMKEKILGLQPQTLEEAARIDEEAGECDPDNAGEILPQSLTTKRKQAS